MPNRLRQYRPFNSDGEPRLKDRSDDGSHSNAAKSLEVAIPEIVRDIRAAFKANTKQLMQEIAGLLGARCYAIIRLSDGGASVVDATMSRAHAKDLTTALLSPEWDLGSLAAHSLLPFSWTPSGPAGDEPDGEPAETLPRYEILFRRSQMEGDLFCILESRCLSEQTDPERLLVAQGLVQTVFERLQKERVEQARDAVRMTLRERECLRWCAEGKTSEEIGIILSLSTHTVNNYLIGVTRKLNAVNRTHAITLALRQGLLDTPPDR